MNDADLHQTKTCLSCKKPVKGRSDKKFCNDYCRNNFNNQLKEKEVLFVRKINNILRSNRKILEMLIEPGQNTGKVNEDRLVEKGYDFRYFTHLYQNKKGLQYSFCYEYGYLYLNADWLLIVKRRDIQVPARN